MNQDQHDKELEEYLDGGSAESKRYAELGDEVPPPELDAMILAQAEREVKVTGIESRRAPPFKAFAWAAIVVLSFSLVLNIVFQEAMQDPVAELEGMAQRSDAPAPASAPVEELVVTARKMERDMASDETGAGNLQPGRAAATEESDDVAAALSEFARAKGSAEDKKSRERQEVPVAVAAQKPSESFGLGTLADVDTDDRAGAAALQVVADYLALPAGAEREQSLMKSEPVDDEAAALERILDLREAGRDAEALAALAEFRSEYPDHPVSEQLREHGY